MRGIANTEETFWGRVREREDGCWIWQGPPRADGYGEFRFEGRVHLAHRLAYRFVVGAVPTGLDLDHLCRNRACVNPAHLEAVTRLENVRRGLKGVLRTHCNRGHALTPENTYVTADRSRICRECKRADERSRYHARKGQLAA